MGDVEFGPWKEVGRCEHGKPILSQMRTAVSGSYDPQNPDPALINCTFETMHECEICRHNLGVERKRRERLSRFLNSRVGFLLLILAVIVAVLFVINGLLDFLIRNL